MKRARIAQVAAAASVAAAAGYGVFRWRKALRSEIERLADILDWRPGRTAADIGAGRGALAVEAARRVRPGGHVFAVDIEPKKTRAIRKKAAKNELDNITVIQGGPMNTNLPDESTDAMLLRGSYHHFTDPARMNADLYRALRPGGRLAVLDFPPRRWLTAIAPVKGAPDNRGGHGIPRELLIDELTAAGFQVERVIPKWFFDVYCVVFRKPARE